MAYTTIDDPTAYFQTTLYTGNGGTNAITNTGNSDLQADWIWFKRRDGADNNILFDSVRGVTKGIYSDLNNAEDNLADSLASFNSDGFTLGADTGSGGSINGSSETNVAWQWKAGTSFTNDASSTGIGTIDSVGSVSTDAGFSIVSWTGTGSNGTIKHGLSSVLKTIIVKNRSTADSWMVYHVGMGNNAYMHLETTNAALSPSTNQFQATTPTSSVFSVGTADGTNKSSSNMIAYCFADIQGYSKFGSYTGNGNADGTYVHLGFKPAFLIIKPSSKAEEWMLMDGTRDPENAVDSNLYANQSYSEADYDRLDIVSNGFKVRTDSGHLNTSGATMIYMAFAENPFVTSTGVPATAR